MKSNMLYTLLGSGWIFLGLFFISGFYFNKFSTQTDGSNFRPVEWRDHMQLFEGVIQCNLTNEDLIERKKLLKEKIFSKVTNREQTQNGYVYYFEYDKLMLENILEFTKTEKACCPFFKFDISILPFDLGIAIQLSGSEEVVEMLEDFESNDL